MACQKLLQARSQEMDSGLGVRHFEDPRHCLREVEGNPKRLKHGCKRWVLGGLVTDLETQQCEQGLDQVRGSVGERLGHHCWEIVIEAGPGQAKKASAKRVNKLVRKKA